MSLIEFFNGEITDDAPSATGLIRVAVPTINTQRKAIYGPMPFRPKWGRALGVSLPLRGEKALIAIDKAGGEQWVVDWMPTDNGTAVAGAPGPQGPQGDIGPQGLQGPQGLTGPQGIQGTTGPAGTPGEKWQQSTTNPTGGSGAVGDWALNKTTGDFFEKTATSTWTLRGNLMGPQGSTGSTGPAGPQGVPGDSPTLYTLDTWHNVGAVGEPAFTNGWVNYGSGYIGAQFRKYPDGKVRLRGLIKSGTSATTAFTLPAGYRPGATGDEAFIASAGGTTGGRVIIYADGRVMPADTGTSNVNAYVYLDGVEFDTDTVTTMLAGPRGADGAPGPTAGTIILDTWHTVGAAGEPAFGAGWSTYVGETPVSFRKYPDGKVLIRGLALKGATAGTQIFTLPVGYRSPNYQRWEAYAFTTANTPAYIYVDSSGGVFCSNPVLTNGQYVDLSVIEFDTETVTTMPGAKGDPGAPGATGPPWVPTSYTLDTWHYAGGTGEPAFKNSWVNYDNSAAVPGTVTQRSLGFRKDPTGRVSIRGVIKTGASGSVVFTLPAAYRPVVDQQGYAVPNSGGVGELTVQASTGDVRVFNITGAVTSYAELAAEFDTDTVTTMLAGPKGDTGSPGAGAGDDLQQGVLRSADCALTVNSTTQVTVAAGTPYLPSMVRVSSILTVLSAIPAAASGNARLDQVVVQADGTIARLQGTEGTTAAVTLATRTGAASLGTSLLLWDLLVTASGVTSGNARDRRRHAKGAEAWITPADYTVDGGGPATIPSITVETGPNTLWCSFMGTAPQASGTQDAIRCELAVDGVLQWTGRTTVPGGWWGGISFRVPLAVSAGRHTIAWSLYRQTGTGAYTITSPRVGVEESLRENWSN